MLLCYSQVVTVAVGVRVSSNEEAVLRRGIIQSYNPDSEPLPAGESEDRSPSWASRFRTLPRQPAFWMYLGLVAILLLVTLLLWRTYTGDDAQPVAMDVDEAVAEALASMAETSDPAISALVYRVILPSLVIVQTGMEDEEDRFGIGAGVVVNADATVLTSLHIVDGASEVRIAFADGSESPAIVTGVDPERDIAVLTPTSLPGLIVPATLGSSSGLRVGDEVFAVGNPLGLVASMSAGVVSGLDRDFKVSGSDQVLQDLIQFDAAVNKGNSGGPLLDRRGQVVGIVTGLVNPSEQGVFIGIGFAVPIDLAASAAGGPAQ